MKHAAFLLFCFLLLAPFHIPLTYANSDTANPLNSPTFATPEQTWEQFKSALVSGDFKTALQCFCQSESKSVHRFEKMAAEKRESIVESMGKLEKVEQHENEAKYRLPRSAKGATFFTYVYFEKENGDWKIASY